MDIDRGIVSIYLQLFQSLCNDGTKIFSELLRLYTWRGPISPYYSFIIFLKLDIFYENRKKWVKIIFSTHALLWYGLRHLESLYGIRFVTWPICIKNPPWICGWLTNFQNRIQNPSFGLLDMEEPFSWLVTWQAWYLARILTAQCSAFIRDHSTITSSKRWMGGVRKWQFLMIYSTVNHQIYLNLKKIQKHDVDDVIFEWSLT